MYLFQNLNMKTQLHLDKQLKKGKKTDCWKYGERLQAAGVTITG